MNRSEPLAATVAAPLSNKAWQVVFGQVRHQRLRPRAHAFRYPAFFLRVPAHQLDGSARGNWLFGLNRPALLSFHEVDHGDSGKRCTPWLHGLLAEAGIQADGEIWLHAFPRVLGYTFKPVSFWYCHCDGGQLVAIVAEVHNTFGERHCYLLSDPAGAALHQGQTLRADKVFHVSPFCEVNGSYRFRFLTTATRTVARIEHHDAAGPLLNTSLSGDRQPLSRQNCLRALTGYPLFTLGVIARIHWQALRLFARRVPFQSKPAPPARLVSRGSP